MKYELSKNPLHLGLGAKALVETPITGMNWYESYVERHASDGKEGRLISSYTMTESWTSWEMHPAGDEVVICTEGEMTLIQEIKGKEIRTELKAGEYTINPPGVWHTADISKSATAIFMTAGVGTDHRPRE